MQRGGRNRAVQVGAPTPVGHIKTSCGPQASPVSPSAVHVVTGGKHVSGGQRREGRGKDGLQTRVALQHRARPRQAEESLCILCAKLSKRNPSASRRKLPGLLLLLGTRLPCWGGSYSRDSCFLSGGNCPSLGCLAACPATGLLLLRWLLQRARMLLRLLLLRLLLLLLLCLLPLLLLGPRLLLLLGPRLLLLLVLLWRACFSRLLLERAVQAVLACGDEK